MSRLVTQTPLERADPCCRINEEAGAEGHLPWGQVIVTKHTCQNVVDQFIMAPTHGILNEWACVGFCVVIL